MSCTTRCVSLGCFRCFFTASSSRTFRALPQSVSGGFCTPPAVSQSTFSALKRGYFEAAAVPGEGEDGGHPRNNESAHHILAADFGKFVGEALEILLAIFARLQFVDNSYHSAFKGIVTLPIGNGDDFTPVVFAVGLPHVAVGRLQLAGFTRCLSKRNMSVQWQSLPQFESGARLRDSSQETVAEGFGEGVVVERQGVGLEVDVGMSKTAVVGLVAGRSAGEVGEGGGGGYFETEGRSAVLVELELEFLLSGVFRGNAEVGGVDFANRVVGEEFEGVVVRTPPNPAGTPDCGAFTLLCCLR